MRTNKIKIRFIDTDISVIEVALITNYKCVNNFTTRQESLSMGAYKPFLTLVLPCACHMARKE